MSRENGGPGGGGAGPPPSTWPGAEAPLACVRPCLLSVCGSSSRMSRPSVYILSFRPRGLERDGPRARSYVRHTRAQISRQNSDGSTTVGRRCYFTTSARDGLLMCGCTVGFYVWNWWFDRSTVDKNIVIQWYLLNDIE